MENPYRRRVKRKAIPIKRPIVSTRSRNIGYTRRQWNRSSQLKSSTGTNQGIDDFRFVIKVPMKYLKRCKLLPKLLARARRLRNEREAEDFYQDVYPKALKRQPPKALADYMWDYGNYNFPVEIKYLKRTQYNNYRISTSYPQLNYIVKNKGFFVIIDSDSGHMFRVKAATVKELKE